MALDEYGDFKFFQHLLRGLMESVLPKVEDMTPIEMAYLAKGLENLTQLMGDGNRELLKGLN